MANSIKAFNTKKTREAVARPQNLAKLEENGVWNNMQIDNYRYCVVSQLRRFILLMPPDQPIEKTNLNWISGNPVTTSIGVVPRLWRVGYGVGCVTCVSNLAMSRDGTLLQRDAPSVKRVRTFPSLQTNSEQASTRLV